MECQKNLDDQMRERNGEWVISPAFRDDSSLENPCLIDPLHDRAFGF